MCSILCVTKFSSNQKIIIFDIIAVRTSKTGNRVSEYMAKSVAYNLHQLFGRPNIFHELNAYGL